MRSVLRNAGSCALPRKEAIRGFLETPVKGDVISIIIVVTFSL